MALTKVTGQVIKNTTDVTVGVLTVTNTLAVGGTVSIGGTLTYEDVTNVDAVGLITARNGIVVGSGITLSKDGDIFATGIVTATSFVGSGANLTGVASTENIRTNTNATFLQNINVSGSTTTGSLVSSGAISGTTGTFSGAVSGTTGTFTGDVDIADKIVHTGDTNTAIRFSGADTIKLETGGSERLKVDSTGDTIVSGTLFADSDLFVVDQIRHTGDTNTAIRFPAADTITAETAGSERIRIDSSGNFMIGATSPSGILHVEHSGENNSYLIGNTSTSGARLVLQNKNTTANSYTGVLGADAGGQTTAQILFYSADNDNNEGYLTLETRPSGGLPTERLRINSSGTTFSFSPDSTTPNIKWRSNDTNWFGSLNQSVAGSTISTILSTGGDWSVSGTTYSATKAIASFPTGALVLHNQYNNDVTGAQLVFLTKAGGSSTTDGTVSERLRIDSSGRVLIGVTASYANASIDELQVGNNSSSNQSGITIGSTDECAIAFADAGDARAGSITYTHAADVMIFKTVGQNERARISADGLMVGTTNSDTGGSGNTDAGAVMRTSGHIVGRNDAIMFTAKSLATGGCTAFRIMSAQTQVGGITFNSGGTSFNTSSDYRRKENVVALTDAITRIKTLIPKRFNFISEPDVTRDGFLAHEVTAVPEAIKGTKDAVEPKDDDEKGVKKDDPIYQELDQSKLVPLLTAALQEAIAKIETLSARLDAGGL